MSKSMKNMLLLAVAQAGLGTPGVPTAGANAILVRAFTPSVVEAEFVERTLIRPYKGNAGSLAVGVHRMFEFEIELASSGAAGTAPKWAPLVKACGFSETLSAGVSATYNLVTDGEPWLTFYGYLDGVLFKITDAKCDVSLELNSKQIPVMKFKALGEYSPASDVTMPTGVDYSGFMKPKTVGKLNTPTCSLFGVACTAQSLSIALGNALSYRDLIGGGGAVSPDRKPTGQASIEFPGVSVMDLGGLVVNGTEGAMSVVHGVGAGNIIELSAPKLQLNQKPGLSNDNSIAMASLSFSLNPNTGNDELVLIAR